MLSDKQLADAFRLMVKAQLFVDVGRRTTFVHDETGAARITVEHDTIVHKGDAVAAACQAVTEAAAACGVAGTVRRQYYYRTNGCTATDAKDPACVCWHDEGTGPRADADPSLLEWRDAAGVTAVAEYKPCPDCSGSGIADNTEHFEDCKPCKGTGNVGVAIPQNGQEK